MSGLEARVATAADAEGICRLYARVFEKEMSEEEWRWKFEANPDGWLGTVAVARGEITGNYAGWGMRLVVDGSEWLVYAIGDVATDPAVRGRGAFRAMTELFYRLAAERGVPFCFGFPGTRHTAISERVVGTRTIFEVSEVSVPCDADAPAPPQAGAGDFVGPEFDPLWLRAARVLPAAAVRDRTRVNWRFHARPNRYYRMVWIQKKSELTSWAALSVSGETALVADYLGSEPDGSDLSLLFRAAAAEARKMGARRLLFWEPPGGPGRAAIATLNGERREAGFPVIVRSFDEEIVRRFAAEAHLVPSLYDVV